MDKRGGGSFRIFCRKFSVSVPKISVGESFTVAIISVIEKGSIRGGISRFFVEVFVSLYRNMSLENNLVFQKKYFSKVFMHRRGAGHHGFAEIFRLTGPAKSFVKEAFSFQENFWYRKKLYGKGGLSQFSVEIFMSLSAQNFRKRILLFLRNFLVPKILWMERGVSRFSIGKFWSHSAEKFRRHPFNVSENLGYRKFLCLIGGITIFRRKFFVSQCRKISWASLQCLRKIGVSKNFMHNNGYDKFPWKLFCLTVPKNFVNGPFSVPLLSGIKKC